MLNVDQSGYALPFEVISMLLLAAMIGCIVIALRIKNQNEENPPAIGNSESWSYQASGQNKNMQPGL